MIKNFRNFLNEADQPIAPPAQVPPIQGAPPAQQSLDTPAPAAQPAPAQAQPSGSTQTQVQAQPAPQQQGQGEQKSGDLSNYNNEGVTKHPETVKKMVDIMKDLDKTQLIKLRNFIAELKNVEDAKEEIGKL
jgi:hypothetical protein